MCETIFFIINLQLYKKDREKRYLLVIKILYTHISNQERFSQSLILTEKKARTIEKFKMQNVSFIITNWQGGSVFIIIFIILCVYYFIMNKKRDYV